ncbi:MAG: hypothetical protein WCJ88_12750 [Actinomycetes bacterium]
MWLEPRASCSFFFYLVVARLNGGTLASKKAPDGFAGAIAEALWHENLDMGTAPAGLLHLSDPYDPVQNAGFRSAGLHDFSLYEGRIYAYFGPTPAVVLFLPYKALGLGYLNSVPATLLCIAGGFLACAAMIRRCIDRWVPDCPWWVETMAIVGVGVGTSLPFLIWIGGPYEVPIASGFLWVAITGWALLRGFSSESRKVLWFVLASTAVGLAVGSRPQLAVAGLLLVAAAYVVMRSPKSSAGWRPQVFALFLPIALIGLILMIHNNARFESPLEFGSRYQLAGVNLQNYPMGQLSYLPPNLGDYLFAGPRLDRGFPFVSLVLPTDPNNFAVYGHEFSACFVTSFPWIPLGLSIFAVSLRLWWRTERDLVLALGTLSAVAVLSLFAVSVTFNASTMRYLVDFVPWFAVVAAVSLAVAIGSKQFSTSLRPVIIAVWSVTLARSCY